MSLAHWAISFKAFIATRSWDCRFGLFQEPMIGLWSVYINNLLPWISSMKCRTAYFIARSSLLKVEYRCCSGLNDFDQKPKGFQEPPTYWSKLAPKQNCDASVDNAKGAEGTGKFNVTAFVSKVFASLNAS